MTGGVSRIIGLVERAVYDSGSETMNKPLMTFSATVLLFIGLTASGQSLGEFKATEAKLSGSFTLTNGYILQPGTNGALNGGRAVFDFTAPSAGQYAVFAVVEAPSHDAHSLFVDIDSEPNDSGSRWEIPVARGFATNLITSAAGIPRYFQLSKGTHQLIIKGGAANLKLSRVSIAMRPGAPGNLHVVTGPR